MGKRQRDDGKVEYVGMNGEFEQEVAANNELTRGSIRYGELLLLSARVNTLSFLTVSTVQFSGLGL